MIKLNVIAVGKLKEKFWVDAVNEYIKRISRFAEINVIQIDEERTLMREGEEILRKAKGLKVVTDIKGKPIDSPGIAELISDASNKGTSEISFIIGSSEGLCDKVKQAADIRISFGAVTYPHQLMRVILCEQLYRAMTIINKITYHK